jgi:hypothetical protein
MVTRHRKPFLFSVETITKAIVGRDHTVYFFIRERLAMYFLGNFKIAIIDPIPCFLRLFDN